MQRIDSPTAVANMFGAGKNGFSDTPPNKTHMNATWFNEVQEELCAILEDQGIALDGLVLDQIAQALNSWQFSGDVGVKSGAELRILSGGSLISDSGSTVTLDDTTVSGELHVDGLADFDGDFDVSGPATFTGDVTVGNISTDTMTVNATATFTAAKTNIGGNEIEGTAGSVVDVETVEVTAIHFDSTVPTSPDNGVLQYDGRNLTIGDDSLATGRCVSIPHDSFVEGPIGPTAAYPVDTGASVTLTLLAGDVCVVQMFSEITNTSTGSTVAFEITANGSTIGGSSIERYVAESGVYVDCCRSYKFTAAAPGLYEFKARYGATSGTASARNILMTARRSN